MRIGADGLKFPVAGQGALAILRSAREAGLDGIFFRTTLEMSPTLDRGELREIRAEADQLGLYLEGGLGKVNPYSSAEAPSLRAIGDGDIALGCRRVIEASADIGCRELWVGLANKKGQYRGMLAYDRFRTDVTWQDQLQATERFLRELAPIARAAGVHLNIETHEEITSFEVVRLVEAIGPDVIGVVFDSSNGLQRMEHPNAAAARVAPFVRQTHLKDAFLAESEDGLRYQVRPCGQGVIDFGAVIEVLVRHNPDITLTIENRPPDDSSAISMHPTIVQWREPLFRDSHPDLTQDEIQSVLELVRVGRERVASGAIEDAESYDSKPYGVKDAFEVLRTSRNYLRTVVGLGAARSGGISHDD